MLIKYVINYVLTDLNMGENTEAAVHECSLD